VPADTPYATMRTDVDYAQFVKPDLGVGRIMADSILDATTMLAKTFFRKEFLPEENMPHWLRRLGKEERGLRRSSLESTGRRRPRRVAERTFYPANEVRAALDKSGLKPTMSSPR